MKTFNQICLEVVLIGAAFIAFFRKMLRPAHVGLLFLLLLLSMCVPATAQTYKSASFINGANLLVLGWSTNAVGGTNVYSKGFTITNSTVYPYVSSKSPTFVTNTAWGADCTLWADRDGTPPSDANISAHLIGATAAFTNTITFNFATIAYQPDEGGTPAVAGTAAQDQWSFSATGNGTADVVIKTNFPSAWVQGSRSVHLVSVVSTTGGVAAGTNGTLESLRLNGFMPIQ